LLTGLRHSVDLLAQTGQLSWRQLEQLMLGFQQKYNSASSRSKIEAAYLDLLRSTRDATVREFQRQAHYLSSQELEQLGEEFQVGYNRASSRSTVEDAYLQLLRAAFNLAYERLSVEILSHHTQTLYALQQQYQDKYNRAPSRSTAEAHYQRARDLVRNEISRRGY
jgi:predicted outer membrane protein